jgi:hypothetical protein
MFRMAVGHSVDIDLKTALAEVFVQCDDGLAGATAIAGLILATWELDHRAAIDAVRARYPGIQLAGTTAAGEMSSILGLREDSIALVLFASDQVDVTVGLGLDADTDPRGAAVRAVAQARAATTREPRLCIALPTVGVDPAVLVEAVQALLGPDVPILGGGAAPNDVRDPWGGSYQFVGDTITQSGLAILLLSGSLAFSFGVDTGWRPLGPRAIVTRASPTQVIEIDGRPAIDFYERRVGPGDPAIANPLAVFETGSDRFFLRAPVTYDRDTGAVTFFGGVPEGSDVQLTMAATNEVFEGTRSAVSTAMRDFPAGRSPEGALVFSCAIRKLVLGTRAGREIEMTRDLVGAGLPVAGFYCFGEIAPISPANAVRFHNDTIVAVLLGAG